VADGGKRRARRAGLITGAIALGVGAVAAAGAAGTRAFLRRERRRPDPFLNEDYGMRRGRSIGPVASFDGTLLNVEEIGTGPTVVLSHGFSLNATIWHHQMRELSSEMRLVMYDHRGHGYSGLPPSEDWSLDALAHDLEAVIRDASNREPVILVGHSMGGMTTLRYCEMFPDAIGARVRGIVLVDTTSADVMGGLLPAVARRLQAGIEGIEEIALRALQGRTEHVDNFRTRANNLVYLGTRLIGFGHDPSPTQVAFIERLLSEVPSSVWFKLIPTMLGMDVSRTLDAISVPSLVVAGEKDKLTPLAAAERIAEGIPDAQLIILPDTGHVPMLERADEFNALLRRFVARVAAADLSR
jgi:pimeloyl-ACP methyl ester carboxylesterase